MHKHSNFSILLGLFFPSGTVISTREDRITGRSTYATSGTPLVASIAALALIINGGGGELSVSTGLQRTAKGALLERGVDSQLQRALEVLK